MSLKAKLEAVIYAAEEPVTLAQLALLFAEEAISWKAEQQAAAEEAMRRAQALSGEGAHDPAAELSDSTRELVELLEVAAEVVPLEIAELELMTVTSARPQEQQPLEPEPREIEQESMPAARVEAEGAPEEAGEPGGDASASLELEARRAERSREREARQILRGLLDELIAEYAGEGRGIEIREIAGGFRMGTKPEIHDAVRSFVKSLKPPMKLSLPALETLAVIAYKQPVTAPEVGEIRGVDSAGVLGSLMSRKLITTAGRKQVIGRPMLYKTTKEFLLRFGLKDLNELPSMEEFEKMAAMELNEPEDVDEQPAPVAESGDLFAQNDEDGSRQPAGEVAEDGQGTEQGPQAPEHEEQEAEAVFNPTAESSQEAAAEHAPVARPDATEVEAKA